MNATSREGAKAQIIVVTKMRALSPVDGRRLKSFMWRWRVMRGGEIDAGGFCATRRDALSDARTMLPEGGTCG